MSRKTQHQKVKDKKLAVEYVKIGTLKPWKKNPRMNDSAVDSIVTSIERFGYTNPILVRRADNRIIAGHTRLKALKEIGEKLVPVIFLDIGKTDADLYALFDNKSTENTEWDIPKLSDLFVNLKDIGADIALTGFSPDEIPNIGPTGNGPGGDSEGVMVFQVTGKQRERIKNILEKLPGKTRTEKLMSLIKDNSKEDLTTKGTKGTKKVKSKK